MCDHICNLCFPGGKDIGHISGRYYLCWHKDKYIVMGGQGHSGDELIFWTEKPISDPTEDKSDNEINDMTREDFEPIFNAMKILEKTETKMRPYEGYCFVKSCIDDKIYDPEHDGYNFDLWLFHYCGKLIGKSENESKKS